MRCLINACSSALLDVVTCARSNSAHALKTLPTFRCNASNGTREEKERERRAQRRRFLDNIVRNANYSKSLGQEKDSASI